MTMNDVKVLIEICPRVAYQQKSVYQDIIDQINRELDITFTDKSDADQVKSDSLDWNRILISLIASGGVLTTLVGLLQANLSKLKQISLEIDGDKITITNPTPEHQDLLIQDWVRRHSTKPRHSRRKELER